MERPPTGGGAREDRDAAAARDGGVRRRAADNGTPRGAADARPPERSAGRPSSRSKRARPRHRTWPSAQRSHGWEAGASWWPTPAANPEAAEHWATVGVTPALAGIVQKTTRITVAELQPQAKTISERSQEVLARFALRTSTGQSAGTHVLITTTTLGDEKLRKLSHALAHEGRHWSMLYAGPAGWLYMHGDARRGTCPVVRRDGAQDRTDAAHARTPRSLRPTLTRRGRTGHRTRHRARTRGNGASRDAHRGRIGGRTTGWRRNGCAGAATARPADGRRATGPAERERRSRARHWRRRPGPMRRNARRSRSSC